MGKFVGQDFHEKQQSAAKYHKKMHLAVLYYIDFNVLPVYKYRHILYFLQNSIN